MINSLVYLDNHIRYDILKLNKRFHITNKKLMINIQKEHSLYVLANVLFERKAIC